MLHAGVGVGLDRKKRLPPREAPQVNPGNAHLAICFIGSEPMSIDFFQQNALYENSDDELLVSEE